MAARRYIESLEERDAREARREARERVAASKCINCCQQMAVCTAPVRQC